MIQESAKQISDHDFATVPSSTLQKAQLEFSTHVENSGLQSSHTAIVSLQHVFGMQLGKLTKTNSYHLSSKILQVSFMYLTSLNNNP